MPQPQIPGPTLYPGKTSKGKDALFQAVDFDEDVLEPPEPGFEITEDSVIIENDDGTATVQLEEPETDKFAAWEDFYGNLADALNETELTRISTELLQDIDYDRQSREDRDKQYAEGIRRTGIGGDAPGGAEFEGASRVTHPMLAEGCIDFAARAIKELFPAKGPCRIEMIGPMTRPQLEKAERKKTFMNWQLTKKISEYRNNLEICLTQVPLGGSQYLKVTVDRMRKRPKVDFVPVDDILLPFAATDFYTAERVTHVQRITRYEYRERVRVKEYRDLGEIGDPIYTDHETESQDASDKVEGKEDASFNTDGVRTFYEVQVYLALKDDPKGVKEDGEAIPLPYIFVIDESTRKVAAVRRNWAEDDENHEKLHWIVEFGLIPWRGAYKVGLAHLIGSLTGAATGALRALMDAALIENFPGGLRMKGIGGSKDGDSKSSSPTELTEVEAPPGVDDIRKLIMPYPFNGPSSVLYQLLEWITNHGTEVIGTAEERLGDSATNAPVGTTLAMIEQGSVTYCAIHGRLHDSQRRVFEIIHRVNSYLIEDKLVVKELGSLVVYAADFEGPLDIIPVSDPNIFSDAQRFAQFQAVMTMAEKYPQFYKLDRLQRTAMLLLNYSGADDILNIPGDPKEMNAIQENVEARKIETTLKAYPEQDHLLHLQMHLQFMTSPIWCANPAMATPSLGKLVSHCSEHFFALYNDHANAAISAYIEIGKLTKDNEEEVMHDALVVMDQRVAQQLQTIMPLWQQAQQLLQQFTPPPPADPMVQVKQMEIQARQQTEQAKQQATQQQNQWQQQFDQMALNVQQIGEKLTAASQERIAMLREQAASQRHEGDLAIGARNADIALQGDQEKNYVSQIAAQLAEEGANQRAALAGQVQLELGQMKADLSNYQAELTSTLDMVREMMGHVMPAMLPQPPAAPAASGD